MPTPQRWWTRWLPAALMALAPWLMWELAFRAWPKDVGIHQVAPWLYWGGPALAAVAGLLLPVRWPWRLAAAALYCGGIYMLGLPMMLGLACSVDLHSCP